jgi:hypothetical protein
MDDFHGFPVRRLTSKFLDVNCLTTAGPRIVGLRYKGSQNLLADVAGFTKETPRGTYRFLGGHRLWHAPENMPRSYMPDNSGVTIFELADGLALEGRAEPDTGIQKRIEIRLDPSEARVSLVHTLSNRGLWDVELAPWALSMFRVGGTAILPTRAETVQLDSLLPDRHVSLWPYSRISDTRLTLCDDFVAVQPTPEAEPFKIGAFNPRGWTAYWLDNVLFRKSYAARGGLRHPDYDCNAEIYCDGHFIELESLGPLQRLAPGESVAHEETWELYDSVDQGFLSPEMRECLTRPARL